MDRIKEIIGNIWGATTTQMLGLLVAIQPVLMAVDPSLLRDAPWLRWVIFAVSVSVMALRFLAPPPPKVTIEKADKVSVNQREQTVTVTKAKPIGDTVWSKSAGEKV